MIAETVGRTVLILRYSQVFNTIHDSTEFTPKEELALVKQIKEQDPEHENDIDWGLIDNEKSVADNKYHWEKMKKLVSSRCIKNVGEMIEELVDYFKRTKQARYNYQSDKDSKKEDEAKISGEQSSGNVNRMSLLEMFRKHSTL